MCIKLYDTSFVFFFFFAIAFVSSSFAHAQYTLKVKRLIILRYVVKISILVHVFTHLVRLSSIAVNVYVKG